MLTHELNNFAMSEAVKFYPQLKVAFSHLVSIDVALNNTQAYLKPSAIIHDFESVKDSPPFGDVPSVILCTYHSHSACCTGFQPVSRLEQYASLLNIALWRLYLVLKQQGVIPLFLGMYLFFPVRALFRRPLLGYFSKS